jgi:hypothetical protein
VKPKLPIHLILGASDYICIKTDQPACVGKTGKPVTEKTKFGWTIIAKGKEILYCIAPHADITTTPTKESSAEAKIAKQVLAVSLEGADEFDEMLEKHTLWKTLRICAWISRFTINCQRCQRKPKKKLKGPLMTEEIKKRTVFWTKCAQSCAVYEKERSALNLQPNEQEVLVCHRRIQCDYPIFLPDTHPFTIKLVEQAHMRTLHEGVGMTMAHIREKYWIPRLCRLAWKAIKKCYGCRRFHAIPFLYRGCSHAIRQKEVAHSK